MKRLAVFLAVVAALCLCATAFADVAVTETTEQRTVPYLETTELGGAAAYIGTLDHPDSPYYTAIDYFTAASEGTLKILSGYRTYQQTTEWSCGMASIMTVLDYFDPTLSAQYDDVMLGLYREKEENTGLTTLTQMQKVFDALGWKYISTLNADIDLASIDPTVLYKYIDAGLPVSVGWMDWGGHWTVLIGYDTMGTESYYDDVLIMADPYDTTDHVQDGYDIVPADRFLYQWMLNMDGVPEDEMYYPFIVGYPADLIPEIA